MHELYSWGGWPHIYTYIHIYIYTYIHTYIYTYIHIYILYTRNIRTKSMPISPQLLTQYPPHRGRVPGFQFDLLQGGQGGHGPRSFSARVGRLALSDDGRAKEVPCVDEAKEGVPGSCWAGFEGGFLLGFSGSCFFHVLGTIIPCDPYFSEG